VGFPSRGKTVKNRMTKPPDKNPDFLAVHFGRCQLHIETRPPPKQACRIDPKGKPTLYSGFPIS
jgi:hypothetical protein